MRSSPLYRSVNTRTHGVTHGQGGDYRHERNAKTSQISEVNRSSMRGRHRHGRDYTPLFRFLISRVGKPWDEVYAEAKSRLDTVDPIFWLVARAETERSDFVRVGESSYFSGLFVDDQGLLSLVNPGLQRQDMQPSCRPYSTCLRGRG
ncbi:MAG: hypothetical protein EOP84_20215 [Verrucomicrobiaceae bacterium]|nr:MAG: hypothetical protein EOP84_20215 [Verrucomicrobiaceae bacterium]